MNLSSASSNSPSTLQAPLPVLLVTTLIPHHQALSTLLFLFPFTLCLLMSSFSIRSLPSTGAMKKRRTQKNFDWGLKRMLKRQ